MDTQSKKGDDHEHSERMVVAVDPAEVLLDEVEALLAVAALEILQPLLLRSRLASYQESTREHTAVTKKTSSALTVHGHCKIVSMSSRAARLSLRIISKLRDPRLGAWLDRDDNIGVAVPEVPETEEVAAAIMAAAAVEVLLDAKEQGIIGMSSF